MVMPPRQLHSPTSIAAAQSIAGTYQAQEADVLDFIRGCGTRGATREEVTRAGVTRTNDSANPRLVALFNKGLIVTHGTRVQASGRRANVYVAVNGPASPPGVVKVAKPRKANRDLAATVLRAVALHPTTNPDAAIALDAVADWIER